MASSQHRMLKLIKSNSNSNFNFPIRHFSSIGERSSFNSNSEEDDSRNSQNPPQPIPNRPLRSPRPETPPSQFQPNTIPFRAEDRGERAARKSQFQANQSSRNGSTNEGKAYSDAEFLEKFKLGLEKKKANETPLTDDSVFDNQNRDLPPPDANEIFNKMKETGLIPNAVAMLDGLCKDGLVHDAMKLFGVMREKGTMPEVVVYTAVIDGFCKARKLDDAKRIFRKMLDNGIAPNAFTYTVLIQGLYKCDSVDDAVDFAFQMLDAGHTPNVVTFVGLVDRLCKRKGVEETRGVIEELRKKGFFVNEKSVREFLDRNAPLSSPVWEAVFGRKPSPKPF
ncbi:Pentatricopeptide repeat (PPR) superfamily protein [Euphorbia peplus]|nr:Pentatricopeptide repeat (PPR) superfamily protein [Euphorbia peplus]